MKEIFKTIKEHFILLLGVGLFVGVFVFTCNDYRCLNISGIDEIVLLAGAIFIVIGFWKAMGIIGNEKKER
jgi:hypothetical protein